MNGLLAIDAGNTRIKWALHDGQEWARRGAVATAAVDALEAALAGLPIDRVMVSNVAGQIVESGLRVLPALAGRRVDFVRATIAACGVRNGYRDPAQLGSDRWAALIGAHDGMRNTGPKLVVMAGTALTVDVLEADGTFVGGVIVPGPALMRSALNRGTAQLPANEGEYALFPARTVDAIATGAVEACVGAIERMYAHLAARSGRPPACIAGGGALPMLAPHLSFPLTINDNLVLDGLLCIARELA